MVCASESGFNAIHTSVPHHKVRVTLWPWLTSAARGQTCPRPADLGCKIASGWPKASERKGHFCYITLFRVFRSWINMWPGSSWSKGFLLGVGQTFCFKFHFSVKKFTDRISWMRIDGWNTHMNVSAVSVSTACMSIHLGAVQCLLVVHDPPSPPPLFPVEGRRYIVTVYS